MPIKPVALAGGGLLCFGGGAAGAHFLKPQLEEKFFSQRLEREKQLRKSFDETTEKSQTQQTQIDALSQQLSNKSTELKQQTDLHKTKSDEVVSLDEEVKEKEKTLEKVKKEKQEADEKLSDLKNRLSLDNEDILTDEALKLNLLEIEIKKVEFKSSIGGLSTFEAVQSDGKKVTFKVQKGSFINHEQKALEIKNKGITFALKDSFNTWDKKITLCTYDVWYDKKIQNASEKNKYTKNVNSEEFTISDYFKQIYLEDAFRVFMAIAQLETLPLQYDLNNSPDNLLYFDSSYELRINFYSTNKLSWSAFTSSRDEDKMMIWTNRFKTKNDFLKYWILKTIDFIKMRKVDLTDLLNPILKSKNYE